MFQQLAALLIIIFFLFKLILQKRKQQISPNEFIVWLLFWLTAALAVVFIRWIDRLVAALGFSGSGIEVLLYIGIATSFYFIFRLRLRLEKSEREITKLTKHIALSDKNHG